MELQLGLALPSNPTSKAFDLNYYGFEANNKEEDDPKDLENHSLFAANKNVGDGDGVVGWPPIKSWRKRLGHDNQVVRAWNNNQMVENGYVCGGRRASNSMYVKVKMEGVVIARKVDLSQHHSFETLTDTLMDMFRKWSEACEKNSNNYKLIYQDREGDWLFAQDVPWRTFIRSVQRLKLLKSSG
ncbi:auxin-responsive protein iaa29 [Quercus suber]|uniref:Auxin-responsive protein n=1 Tax=Quercus suber TaxID=58331 RepID=A0AAW0M2V1_QUESU